MRYGSSLAVPCFCPGHTGQIPNKFNIAGASSVGIGSRQACFFLHSNLIISNVTSPYVYEWVVGGQFSLVMPGTALFCYGAILSMVEPVGPSTHACDARYHVECSSLVTSIRREGMMCGSAPLSFTTV